MFNTKQIINLTKLRKFQFVLVAIIVSCLLPLRFWV